MLQLYSAPDFRASMHEIHEDCFGQYIESHGFIGEGNNVLEMSGFFSFSIWYKLLS